MYLFFVRRLYFFVLLCFFCCSCVSNQVTRGNFVSDVNLDEIKKGSFDKEKIVEFLGPPSFVDHETDHWYYLSRTINERPLKNSVFSQRVVRLVFDKDQGNVLSVLNIDDSHNDTIILHPAVYDEENIMRIYFGGISLSLKHNKESFVKKYYVPNYF